MSMFKCNCSYISTRMQTILVSLRLKKVLEQPQLSQDTTFYLWQISLTFSLHLEKKRSANITKPAGLERVRVPRGLYPTVMPGEVVHGERHKRRRGWHRSGMCAAAQPTAPFDLSTTPPRCHHLYLLGLCHKLDKGNELIKKQNTK